MVKPQFSVSGRFGRQSEGLQMRRLGLVVAFLGTIFFTGGAGAATPAGKAVGVDPAASDVVANVSRTLVVGSNVAMGDRIVTGPSGQVQLIFNDQTHLVVGPNSGLLIESYLLRSDRSVGKFTVDALGGTYRFITGQSDHSVYTIKTPTGTIGVRGTAFDFTVAAKAPRTPSGPLAGTAVALFAGAVELCDLPTAKNPTPKCVVLDHKCDAGVIDSDAYRLGRLQTQDMGLRNKFRYIESQAALLQPFQLDTSRQCFLNTQPGGGGLSTTMSSPDAPPRPPQRGFNAGP
jgi:hypothetical protein